MENFIFLFLSFLCILQSIKSDLSPELLAQCQQLKYYCMPNPSALTCQTLNQYSQDCKSAKIYPALAKTNRTFLCCSIKMKRNGGKESAVLSNINGCMAIMQNYIKDDRYEDILDYFQRGKQYKLQNYFVMLGKTVFNDWNTTFLPLVNGTKYDVEELDCYSKYNVINILIILATLFLIY